ncbi:LLM class flavin-dependent oxidoreductase [Paenibacillus sp. FSL E2-0178]|uniref:LLM class flavin-dependent oxidoreductase n=1 Tax=Paenibacillus sp. FSL E2-0178 TaxID=2921361 RepID=UPI00315940A4
MKLSILDQSPVSEGSTPAEALAQTVLLAREAERLGYHRFWVAEHHAAPGLAGSSPEVLMAHLAAVTSEIRIGSGAVLLPHYSAYKVAENFRVLEALYPGRIDLGVGRAAGGGALSARALQDNRVNPEDIDRYEQQLKELIAYLHESDETGAAEPPHPYAGLQATPAVSTAPEIWLLGSSSSSAGLSARLGTGYAFAQFINGNGGAEAVREYADSFAPSRAAATPQSLVAVFAVCAGTSEEADRLAASMDLSLVLLEKEHLSTATPSVETAMNYTYTPYDRFSIKDNRRRMVVGSPGEVREQLQALADEYQCGELMISSHIHSFEDKLTSLRLIAEACGLTRRE